MVGDHKGFSVVLRGYDAAEVDAMLQRIQNALASADPNKRASVREELDHSVFHIRMRGYDRTEVDDYLRKAIDRLA